MQRSAGEKPNLMDMAKARLSEQFRTGSVEKTCLAMVQGVPDRPAARLMHQLVRRGRLNLPVEEETAGSRPASLSYRILGTRSGRSLLEVRLETGRRHQIRVQLAAIGCPVMGDVHYGPGPALPHGRIALIASRLAFVHPTGKEAISLVSPVPEGRPWPLSSHMPDRPYWTIFPLTSLLQMTIIIFLKAVHDSYNSH